MDRRVIVKLNTQLRVRVDELKLIHKQGLPDLIHTNHVLL